MTARPILFSGPMIRALLEGRKTQTRRTIKAPTARGGFVLSFNHGIPEFNFGPDDRKRNGDLRWHRCPYGQPGDLLWVRETWADLRGTGIGQNEPAYAASTDSRGNEIRKEYGIKWKPSIHMPRWASRLTLRITDVRVQRLQDISNENARDEGVDWKSRAVREMWKFGQSKEEIDAMYLRACRWEFEALWESINGPGSWEANPWVWALTFEVIKQNITEIQS